MLNMDAVGIGFMLIVVGAFGYQLAKHVRALFDLDYAWKIYQKGLFARLSSQSQRTPTWDTQQRVMGCVAVGVYVLLTLAGLAGLALFIAF
jgi:hypothetical protein